MLASGGAGSELLSIWGRPSSCMSKPTLSYAELSMHVTLQHPAVGHWARGTLQQAYLEKNPLSALVAFAIAAGWDQTSFMRRHFCGRALVRLSAHDSFIMCMSMHGVLTSSVSAGVGARAMD